MIAEAALRRKVRKAVLQCETEKEPETAESGKDSEITGIIGKQTLDIQGKQRYDTGGLNPGPDPPAELTALIQSMLSPRAVFFDRRDRKACRLTGGGG